MTDDIVTRLREMWNQDPWATGLLTEAADEIERLRAEVARLGSFLHPIGAVVNGASGSRAETKWVGSDGTITNLDPNTEMGLWIRLFHNECDRSAHLEREIERLRAEVLKAYEGFNYWEERCIRAEECLDFIYRKKRRWRLW